MFASLTLITTSPPQLGQAKYCDDRARCLSVCLSASISAKLVVRSSPFSRVFPTFVARCSSGGVAKPMPASHQARHTSTLAQACSIDKSVFSNLRKLKTWHCPHSPAARRCCSNRTISSAPGPTAANLHHRVCCCGLVLGRTDGRTLYRFIDSAPRSIDRWMDGWMDG